MVNWGVKPRHSRELELGASAVVDAVGGEGALRQHFLDMGVIPGAQVTLAKYAPMGDPMELRIHGYELMLRLDGAICGYANTLVTELPNYRMPNPRSVIQLLWEKAKESVVAVMQAGCVVL